MALFVRLLVLLEDAPIVEDAGTVLTDVAMAGPVGGGGGTGPPPHIASGLVCPPLVNNVS